MAGAPFRIFDSNILARSFIVNGIKVITASATATRKTNAGRSTRLDASGGLTVTLPTSTGSGNSYRFVVGVAAAGGNYVIKVNNATDVFRGGVMINDIGDTTAATCDFFPTASTSDTYTMTASIGGGKVGDWVEFEDAASGFWFVRGTMQGVTDPASPFSATV